MIAFPNAGVAEAAREGYADAVRDVAALPPVRSLAGGHVCVAGFTGQVGATLVRILTEANIRVTGIARGPRSAVPDGVDAVYADVSDLSGALSLHGFTHVFYAVGITSDYRSRPDEVISSQLVGLERFLERVDPDCRFVFVSSARVYGRHPVDTPLLEESAAIVAPMHLDNLYDSTKRLAESLCLSHAERRGLHVTVIRAGNLYGLGAPQSRTSVSELVREAAATQRVTLTGHPSSLRNYCSAVDSAQGMLLAAANGAPGRPYNVGSDEHLTTQQLGQAIAACFDERIEIVARPAGAPSFQHLSIERARTELGYTPRLRLNDALPAVAAELAGALRDHA